MSTYELGQTLQWELQVRDAAGALADLGGGLPSALVTLPDGTTANANIEQTATGAYVATLTSSQAGRHRVTWSGSGTNSGGLPASEVADVWPADPRLIISLADARAALNIADAKIANDDELRLYIAAATWVVEDVAGPVLAATVTETHSGRGRRGILLRQAAASVTAVTEDGTELVAGADYVADLEAGIVFRGARRGAAVWSDDAPGNVVVSMTVGAAVVPANVVLAARELVRHLYAVGQQPWRAPYGGGLDDVQAPVISGSGFAVPRRVVDLLGPARGSKVPGFA